MDTQAPKFKARLGMFIALGVLIFLGAIFIIGKQKNLFNPVFKLTAKFLNVSGLQVGNNIRFAGINVGTVDKIEIINDSTVQVDMFIRKEVQKFIKEDCEVSIGSEGIIGDRIIVITSGSQDAPEAKDGQELLSNEPVETDAIVKNLNVTAYNSAIVSNQLAEILIKVNSGNGTLGRLIQDSTIAENIDQTIANLKTSSQGLNQNMEAAKDNILLRGYFKKKRKAAEKKNDSLEQKSNENKK